MSLQNLNDESDKINIANSFLDSENAQDNRPS